MTPPGSHPPPLGSRFVGRRERWAKHAILGTALAWQGSDLIRILWPGPASGDVLATHLACLASIPVFRVSTRLVANFLASFPMPSDAHRRLMGYFPPIAAAFFGAIAVLCLVSKATLVVRGADWFPGLGPVPQSIFLMPASLSHRLRFVRGSRRSGAR